MAFPILVLNGALMEGGGREKTILLLEGEFVKGLTTLNVHLNN
jgi:hypothetical protein